MLSAVTITGSGFAASGAFYDAVLSGLGWVRAVELVDEEEDDAEVEALGWGPVNSAPQLWLVPGDEPTTGLHVRITAQSRQDVETFALAAARNGGSLHASPRRWTVFRRGEFGATVRDPDGNLLEAVAPE